MTLQDMIKALDDLSPEERQRIREELEGRDVLQEAMDEANDRQNMPLDIEALKRLFGELREGFTQDDLDELEWAMNLEVIDPLDDVCYTVKH